MSGRALAFALCIGFAASGCGRGVDDARSIGDPHSGVSCGSCHSGSSAGFATRPAPPAACADCHGPGSLPATVSLGGIEFAHTSHAEVSPGVPIPCGGCHTHGTGGEPLEVSSGSCFLCHGSYMDTEAGLAAASDAEREQCRVCHQTLTHTAQTSAGALIPHAVVAERGISCLGCHYDVLKGSGLVSDAGCVECHGRGSRYRGSAETADSMHALHLTAKSAIACTRCHGSLSHEVVGLASAIQLNCLNCHAEAHGLARPAEGDAEWARACLGCHDQAHRAQQELYTGLGREGAGQLPAVMFLARVSCGACHREARASTPLPAAPVDAMNDACVACHGAEYRFMLPQWYAALEEKVSLVARYVERAGSEKRLRAVAAADSALARAAASLSLVIAGNGLHNVPAADVLLRGALEDAERAYREASLSPPAAPRLGPDPATVSCAHCHYGVETVVDTVFGQQFGHRPHVLNAEIACEQCHTPVPYFDQGSRRPNPQHGVTTVTREDCQACHHTRGTSCDGCHDRQQMTRLAVPITLALQLTPAEATDSRVVSFEHAAHLALECSTCHAPGLGRAAATTCSDCHGPHHGGSASCLSCHGSEMGAAHSVADHFDCARCHGEGTLRLVSVTRQFCLACHPSRIDHETGRECTPCHMQSSPAEVKARIVGR